MTGMLGGSQLIGRESLGKRLPPENIKQFNKTSLKYKNCNVEQSQGNLPANLMDLVNEGQFYLKSLIKTNCPSPHKERND